MPFRGNSTLQQNETDIATSVVVERIIEEESLLPSSTNKNCTVSKQTFENKNMEQPLETNDNITDDPKKSIFGSTKYVNCLKPFVSLLLSAFGACVMAVASVMVKKLTSTSVFAIIMIRFVVMLTIAIPILCLRYEINISYHYTNIYGWMKTERLTSLYNLPLTFL